MGEVKKPKTAGNKTTDKMPEYHNMSKTKDSRADLLPAGAC